ncbi:hypothetical protein P154DRAFT_542081 [Amniculicola lignicola CBS 123094]|uniref:N-acetyltransferase domain-containing protein n=1 Tax=Amniculicola lignicola CBS 123094 TaxID=1392246 RepID=A0A6A5X0K6_9PLEO|nr:hypothetical protein P154DRAFT_542081 [Amniculicola lignicola CBS 123094]
MEGYIETERLKLIRLAETSEGSQHVQWFHECWSDDDATAWSMHGKCHSLEESRDWMIQHRTKWDNQFYAILLKPQTQSPRATPGDQASEPGELIGSISIRLSPSFPPVPSLSPRFPPNVSSTTPLDFRFIGYAFFRRYWGNGYATEAGRAVVPKYAEWRKNTRKDGEISYLESQVDVPNPASGRVMEKLGFEKVGLKETKEKVFLGGEWLEGSYWVYGLFV